MAAGAGRLVSPDLLLDRDAADTAFATWGLSCSATDGDYAIYRGTLGAFASHIPERCSTGGLTSSPLEDGEDDAYYLVVPRNAAREGAYGNDGAGLPRSASQASCVAQKLAACASGAVAAGQNTRR